MVLEMVWNEAGIGRRLEWDGRRLEWDGMGKNNTRMEWSGRMLEIRCKRCWNRKDVGMVWNGAGNYLEWCWNGLEECWKGAGVVLEWCWNDLE